MFITAIAPLLLIACVMSGTCALVAAVLAFGQSTRKASMRFAFACMILTVIACLLELLGITFKTLTVLRTNLVPQIAMILGPLIVAMIVYRRARCAMERDRQATNPAHSKTE